MTNFIPFIGPLLTWFCYVTAAIPFWFCWSLCGLGEKYFPALPDQWQYLPFWDCVGLCFCISIAKAMLTPRFASQINVSK
jgi:hypothetical protein